MNPYILISIVAVMCVWMLAIYIKLGPPPKGPWDDDVR
jgi:hypothetical protein